jgi:hypothetical protein
LSVARLRSGTELLLVFLNGSGNKSLSCDAVARRTASISASASAICGFGSQLWLDWVAELVFGLAVEWLFGFLLCWLIHCNGRFLNR